MRVSFLRPMIAASSVLLSACDIPLFPLSAPLQLSGSVTVKVTAQVTSLVQGVPTQLGSVTVTDRSGRRLPSDAVAWSSADPTVATVAPGGVATGLVTGTAKFRVQYDDAVDSLTLPVFASVNPPQPPQPPPSTGLAVLPEPPRVWLKTSMPARGGRTINVPSNGDLQAALNQALPGDDIVLQAGATYSGSFILPQKAGANTTDPESPAVITVRSSALASLPEGRRVRPSDAQFMARLVTPSNDEEPIGTAAGTAGWRLAGLEITTASAVTTIGRLVRFGDGSSAQNTTASVPQNLVLDRSYVHAGPTVDVRRCVDLQSGHSAIIHSYLSECHSVGFDAQAIANWNGPGPYKIVDNYLEGSGENVMFGGAPTFVPGQVAADIEIRRNHFFKPLSWKQDDPSYAGTPWSVKNLFEIKQARRVHFEGNVLENSWVEAQVGFAILMKSDGASFPSSDIMIKHNIVRGAANGINIAGTAAVISRVAVVNNLLIDIGSTKWDPRQENGGLFQIMNVTDATLLHNTGVAPNYMISLDGAPSPRLTVLDNVMSQGTYGLKGSGKSVGTPSLAFYAPGYQFVGNVVIGGDIASYPSGNFSSASVDATGFTSVPTGDYSLLATSLFAGKASDRTNPGIDAVALTSSTLNAKP
jgi:hypothetical protein